MPAVGARAEAGVCKTESLEAGCATTGSAGEVPVTHALAPFARILHAHVSFCGRQASCCRADAAGKSTGGSARSPSGQSDRSEVVYDAASAASPKRRSSGVHYAREPPGAAEWAGLTRAEPPQTNENVQARRDARPFAVSEGCVPADGRITSTLVLPVRRLARCGPRTADSTAGAHHSEAESGVAEHGKERCALIGN
jgi:hypothetical protein